MRLAMLLCFSVAMGACDQPVRSGTGPGNGAPGSPSSTTGGGDPEYSVFANSSTELYRIDPDTFEITLIGAFGWPEGGDLFEEMTDIALDRSGKMIGTSFDNVYSVSPTDASCNLLAKLDRRFNGLSFVPGTNGGEEMLVGADLDGNYYQLDPNTGASTLIGAYGGGMVSSGDIVSVDGLGTIATVAEEWGLSDKLARINPKTGAATVIGETGVEDIWGLGYWKNKIFGFTSRHQFVLIDPNTAATKVMQTGQIEWWGAAVTTNAPVIQ